MSDGTPAAESVGPTGQLGAFTGAPRESGPAGVQPNVRPGWSPAELSWRFWVLVLATGVGAGLGAAGFVALLHVVQHASYGYSSGPFLDGVRRASGQRRVLVLALAGLFAGVAWALLRRHFRATPTLSEAVWERDGELPFTRTLLSGIFQIVIVAMGAALGREGAPKDVGAALAAKLAGWGRLTPSQQRLLVASGAGAGMGAVYNVPLGAGLFAAEVLLGSLALADVLPALATALVATAVGWIVVPTGPTYAVPAYPVTVSVVVWAVLFGPAAGLASVALIRLTAWSRARRPAGTRLVLSTTVVFTLLGLVSVAFPEVLGNGKNVSQEAFVGRLGLPLLAALVLLRPAATAACLRCGAQGGLFTPTLTAGALLGGLLGGLWSTVWPGAATGVYAVVGATAVLAASTQGPLSSVALMLELAHHGESTMVPTLIAVVGASIVCGLLDDRSIYSSPLRPATRRPWTHPRPSWARVRR